MDSNHTCRAGGALAFLMLTLSLGCSSAAGESTDTSDPPPDPDPVFDGKFMGCTHQPTGQHYTVCLAEKSVIGSPGCPHGPQGFSEPYLESVCAHTFGGSPEDYEGGDAVVGDYPDVGDPQTLDCVVGDDYDALSETPAVSAAVLFPFGEYDECDVPSYCETVHELNELYATPTFWFQENAYLCGDASFGAYRCMGSRDLACGFEIVDGMSEIRCPGGDQEDKEYCVLSFGAAGAAADCQAVCEADHAELLDSNANYPQTMWMDCTVFTANNVLFTDDVPGDCVNQDPLESNQLAIGKFSVSLLTNNGGSTTSTANDAYITYVVDNCTVSGCDIEISSVLVPYQNFQGDFFDANGSAYPWEVDGVSLRLLAPVQGTVDSSGILSFPSSSFDLWLATGAVEFAGLPFDSIDGLRLNPEVGGRFRSGVLRLNITYSTIDADVSITLVTQ